MATFSMCFWLPVELKPSIFMSVCLADWSSLSLCLCFTSLPQIWGSFCASKSSWLTAKTNGQQIKQTNSSLHQSKQIPARRRRGGRSWLEELWFITMQSYYNVIIRPPQPKLAAISYFSNWNIASFLCRDWNKVYKHTSIYIVWFMFLSRQLFIFLPLSSLYFPLSNSFLQRQL